MFLVFFFATQTKEALEEPSVVDDGTPGLANGIGGYDGDGDDSGTGSSSFSAVEDAEATQASAPAATSTSGVGNAERLTGAAAAEGPPSYAEARRLFELGILADPTHGPLYNAYG